MLCPNDRFRLWACPSLFPSLGWLPARGLLLLVLLMVLVHLNRGKLWSLRTVENGIEPAFLDSRHEGGSPKYHGEERKKLLHFIPRSIEVEADCFHHFAADEPFTHCQLTSSSTIGANPTQKHHRNNCATPTTTFGPPLVVDIPEFRSFISRSSSLSYSLHLHLFICSIYLSTNCFFSAVT